MPPVGRRDLIPKKKTKTCSSFQGLFGKVVCNRTTKMVSRTPPLKTHDKRTPKTGMRIPTPKQHRTHFMDWKTAVASTKTLIVMQVFEIDVNKKRWARVIQSSSNHQRIRIQRPPSQKKKKQTKEVVKNDNFKTLYKRLSRLTRFFSSTGTIVRHNLTWFFGRRTFCTIIIIIFLTKTHLDHHRPPTVFCAVEVEQRLKKHARLYDVLR
uniref:Uncharacterized protein n=1 Tax=Rhizophora mucronata TaxID=61149 RepID=A0A2P2L807_RHIMU